MAVEVLDYDQSYNWTLPLGGGRAFDTRAAWLDSSAKWDGTLGDEDQRDLLAARASDTPQQDCMRYIHIHVSDCRFR
jgi:hypothetical protein